MTEQTEQFKAVFVSVIVSLSLLLYSRFPIAFASVLSVCPVSS